MTPSGPVVVATDLTDASRPALQRARGHARATGAPLVVCHVIVDVFRHHPLIPNPAENELLIESNVIGRVADLVTEQAVEVLGLSPDELRVVVESGTPEEEIVRIAENEGASLIVVGAKVRGRTERVLGHVAERVVRCAHTSVLVARGTEATRKIVVATDFSAGSLAALRLGRQLSLSTSAEVALIHVVRPPSSALPSALMPLGDTWTPPAKAALEQLEELGRSTLASLATEYGFGSFEQLQGDPADVIVDRAEALGADLVITGSRGRTGLRRLLLGSVAEKVIRTSRLSVLVARDAHP